MRYKNKYNMSRTLLNSLGPVGVSKHLCLTEEQAKDGRCYGLTGPGGEINTDNVCRQYVDINVDNDKVEQVMTLWNTLTHSKVLHGYTHKLTTNSKVLGDITIREGQLPKYEVTYVFKDCYKQVEEIYIKNGIVRDEKEFYTLQYNLLYDHEDSSLLEEKNIIVEEGIEPLFDNTGKTVRLELYLGDLSIIGMDKVRDAVEQINNSKR